MIIVPTCFFFYYKVTIYTIIRNIHLYIKFCLQISLSFDYLGRKTTNQIKTLYNISYFRSICIYTHIFVEQSTVFNVTLILKNAIYNFMTEIISAFYDIKMSRGFVCLNVFHLVQMKSCNIMEDLLRAQPYRQSHEGGIVDLLFLGPCFKTITVDVVMLLRQGITGPKLGPSSFSIHKETVFTLYFCLDTLMSY